MTKWQKATRERDGHKCAICNSTERLHVHHKDESRKLGLKLMNNKLENLITLCFICHLKIHRKEPVAKYKEAVVLLRNEGYSYGEISNILKKNKASLINIVKNEPMNDTVIFKWSLEKLYPEGKPFQREQTVKWFDESIELEEFIKTIPFQSIIETKIFINSLNQWLLIYLHPYELKRVDYLGT